MKHTFLSLVTDGLIGKAGGIDNLKRFTLVFPSQRAGLFLKDELKKRLAELPVDTAVYAPQIITLDALVGQLSALQPTDEIASIVELYSIYKDRLYGGNAPAEMPLDIFYGWGRQLITDFDNAEMGMGCREGAHQLLSHSIDIKEEDLTWVIDEETRRHLRELIGLPVSEVENSQRKQFEALWQAIPGIYEAFRDKQQEQQVGTRGARMLDAIGRIRAGEEEVMQSITNRTFAFIGFNYLMEAERQLMQALREKTEVLFYWDYRQDFTANSSAYKFMRKNIEGDPESRKEGFPNALPEEETETSNSRHVTAISAVTTNSQAQYVHNWLSQEVKDHKEGEKVAVVIADESLLEPVLYALPASISGQVNITKGYPLKSTKAFADIINRLADPKREKEIRASVLQEKGADYADADKEVRDRMLQSLVSFLDRETLDAYTEIRRNCPDAFEHHTTDKAETKEQDRKEALPWDYNLMQESYYQARLVITRFQHMLEKGGVLQDITSIKTLRSLIRQEMGSVNMPFHGEPVTDYQIIGVLETRLLDFDRMLILNVEEGVIPRTPIDRSFIPYFLRKIYHLQTPDEDTAIYAYNFFRLFRRCPDATVVYTNAIVDNSEKTMSRFLMQMILSDEFSVEMKWLQEAGDLEQGPTDTTPHRTFLDTVLEKEAERTAHPEKYAGSPAGYSLSPSAINTYLHCPRRFFFEQVKGIRVDEPEEPIFQPNEQGSLIHGMLEYIYRHISGMPVAAGLPLASYPIKDAAHDRIRDFLDQKKQAAQTQQETLVWKDELEAGYRTINEDWYRYHPEEKKKYEGMPLPPHYFMEDHPVENKVAIRNVKAVLRNDSEKSAELSLVEEENDRRILLTVPVEGQSITFRLGGKIDRLDLFTPLGGTEKYLRILDYKTGSYKSEKQTANAFEDIFEVGTKQTYMLQTLLYCLICAEDPDIQSLVKSIGHPLKIMPQLLFTRKSLDNFDPTLGIRRTDETADKKGETKTKKAVEPVKDFALIQEEFTDRLITLLQQILCDQEFAFCDEAVCYKSCPFHLLCGREKTKDFSK